MQGEDWPTKGSLEFKDVELRYRKNTELVLKKLSFNVQAGQKIGIVGRTGAGKSTMSMALSRLVELEDGLIQIDGVDIAKVDLNTLRSRITFIPQDPCLFTGSLRYNIDPFNQFSDQEIEKIAIEAGLQEILSRKQTADMIVGRGPRRGKKGKKGKKSKNS